jgi:LuxR family maltose regulon positive regulatory protein
MVRQVIAGAIGAEQVSTSLLKTKLYAPPIRPELVSRPRLVERLDEGSREGSKLTLLSAPAGYGKTTLVGEWIAHCGLRPHAAWLSLDQSDNDPARFWTYVAAALRTVEEDIEEIPQSAFRSSHASSVESALTHLLNQLAGKPGPFVLILDDYHEVDAPAIHDALSFLLENQPPQMHMVIATRADPPLPIPRLRGRGQLVELYQSDLRFTSEEAAEFLNQAMGLDLPAEDVAALERRTEGWIAGLQMVAVSMRGRDDTGGFVRAFTGSHRYILDYLGGEVLRQQPEDIREFLLQTSILDRLCAPLCNAVVEDTVLDGEAGGSQAVLESMESNNLFVVALDDERRWYRYHRLFADLLRQRVRRERRELVTELHRRASAWHEENGPISEAVNHAVAGRDFERVASLVEQSAWPMLTRGEMTTLLGWLDAMPEGAVRARPRLGILRAWALALTSQLDEADSYLSDVDVGYGRGEVDAVRGYIAHHRGQSAQAIEQCQRALELLPEADWFSRGFAAVILGTAPLSKGDAATASRALTRAVRIGREAGQTPLTLIAMTMLGEGQEAQGLLHQAIQTHREALRLASEYSTEPMPFAGMAYVGLAGPLYERNDLDEAMRCAKKGLVLSKRAGSVDTIEDAYFNLALLHHARGNRDAALESIQELENVAQRRGHSAWMAKTRAMRSWWLLEQGNVTVALRFAEESSLRAAGGSDYVREYPEMARARVLLAQAVSRGGARSDEPRQASRSLADLLQGAEAVGRMKSAVKILALQALAFQTQGDAEQALSALERALSLAEPEGYVRTFIDEGEPMARLLRLALSRGIAPDYVARLLAALGEEAELAFPTMESLVEPLTERELDVLRLIVAGLSNPEIAEELFIAVSTVKSHVNHIYGKLGVTSRTQAVVKAQELGLL